MNELSDADREAAQAYWDELADQAEIAREPINLSLLGVFKAGILHERARAAR
jgi:hypothetical protein